MLKVGPNPYGLCCTLGLQGNVQEPKDLNWFIGLAEKMHGRCIEFHCQHLIDLTHGQLRGMRLQLESFGIEPVISGPWPLSRIHEAIPIALTLGARTVRTHLSPILCGARAAQGDKWPELVEDIKVRLAEQGPKFAADGLTLAIENHQDFGSDELLAFCELGGPSVGITLDTGNPLAVAEDPVDFARKVAHKVSHVHLKDYRVQRTSEGYRLVRCAIGDGCIPFPEIADILLKNRKELTATLEPGALDARHVKLNTEDWWRGYPTKPGLDSAAKWFALTRIREIWLHEEYRTPWELGQSADAVSEFEMEQMMKSVSYVKSLGWLPA